MQQQSIVHDLIKAIKQKQKKKAKTLAANQQQVQRAPLKDHTQPINRTC